MNTLVLSIFPGIDLLGRSAEEVGFTVVRGPDVLWGGDIRQFHVPAGVFGGIIGGPPCQSFSRLVHLVRHNGHEPRFGNLIPEFERCVEEGQPPWFLMENVPEAPVPQVKGYWPARLLMLNSRWVGMEQNRLRRFCFGMRYDYEPRSLDVSPDIVIFEHQHSTQAILTSTSNVPIKIGGNGKVKASYNGAPTVTSNVGGKRSARKEYAGARSVTSRGESPNIEKEYRNPPTVTAGHNGGNAEVKGMVRYSIGEAARLQGFPDLTMDDAPFTKDGKLKAIANGVPREMGLAVCKAIWRIMTTAEVAV